MREELIKVLNYKLNDIEGDIEALENLNKKIDEEKEKAGFVSNVLSTFKKDEKVDVMNLVNLSKDDFDRSLDIAGDDIKDSFNSGACNYDGLVYLINGINSGVSLTLTDEQKGNVEKLVDKLSDKKKEFDSAIDGYTLVKSRYEINDISELKEMRDCYQKVIDGIDQNNYIKDTNLLTDAIKFSSLSPEETVDLLTYVLEYNAEVYKEGKPVYDETTEVTSPEEESDDVSLPEEKKEEETDTTDDYNYDNDFHFNQIDNSNLFELPNITFDEEQNNDEVEEKEVEKTIEIPVPDEENTDVSLPGGTVEEKEKNDDYIPEYQEYTPYVEKNEEEEVSIPDELTYVPETEETPLEDNVQFDEPDQSNEQLEEASTPQNEEESQVEQNIDNDFQGVIDIQDDYEDRETQEEEKTSTRELQKIFSKYGIEENTVLNELIDGNINEYQNILDSLKDNGILESFRNNRELLIETLLYSNMDVIDKVLRIVKEDLSVDDEDYEITLKIVINTIPSIFVKDGGNYDNFIKNVELFKEQGINLINLFDFSKEVFVANHDLVVKNTDIVNRYGFDINYKNAKYLLLIPNIADKLDYYIESVYEDKEKGETFDGINYIKEYAAKLNVVTDETIKRLRYASENGKKVFGSKPGSLSGEITNLKVNALDISDEYLNKFFDNEFANLTGDEVREYIKLIHNSSNVGDYSDELDILNKYHDGLRYDIEGIKVSYNKVVRNYSILRSYGMDTNKALQFAVCYNLVITKDEYDKLNDLLEKIGGNL